MCSTIGWWRSTGIRRPAGTAACSSARRIRRAAGRSVSSSCPGWRSVSCRSGRARIRCCSTSGGGQLDAELLRQPGPGRGRTPAAQDGDWRGRRAAVPVVSPARGRRRDARARAVVLRARRDAGDHRDGARSPGARGAGGRRGRREPRVAGAGRSRSRDRRSRARPRHAAAAARLARSGVGQRAMRTTCSASTTRSGDRSSAAGRAAARHGPTATASSGSRLGSPAAIAANRLAQRKYSLSALQRYADVPLPVPARDDPPSRAVGGSGTHRAAGSADARQPVPRRAGRVLPHAPGRGPRCRSRTRPCPRR